jgi:Na+/H+ antiporter NhaD/arsenite permease-like protein
MHVRRASALAAGITAFLLPRAARSAELHLDGAGLGLAWVVPFAGMLLSIAVLPLLAPRFWHHHFGKVSLFWSLCVLLPMAALHGPALTLYELVHVALLEYLPFIILLLALFTITGGIRLASSVTATPAFNTGLLAVGTALASWTGTTGAAMALIRPLLRANAWRRNRAHVVIFFIFLVANIGGSLTPLGDPPLFLGFLKGVPFFWPTTHLLLPMLVASLVLLTVFYALDAWMMRRDGPRPAASGPGGVRLEGGLNLVLLAGVVGAVLLSGTWRPGVTFSLYHVEVGLEGLVRDVLLLLLALASWVLTARPVRQANDFSWFPIVEVAKLFAGIFITIVPAIAILHAGREGALGSVVAAVTDGQGEPIDAMYFWLTGILSSFLDNAPTYLVFFNTAGGDPAVLTTTMASTLLAISAGAVFMGANTYIGNAPNFMVRAIAEESGVEMPSFFGYMAWSGLILLPLFALLTLLFF